MIIVIMNYGVNDNMLYGEMNRNILILEIDMIFIVKLLCKYQ